MKTKIRKVKPNEFSNISWHIMRNSTARAIYVLCAEEPIIKLKGVELPYEKIVELEKICRGELPEIIHSAREIVTTEVRDEGYRAVKYLIIL